MVEVWKCVRMHASECVCTEVLVYVCILTILYAPGKDDTLPASSSVTESVVLELAKGLENRGHNLYCDNYYTSIPLFSSLQRLGFGACGTVRSNRRGVPKEVTTTKLAKGEVLTAQADHGILAMQWKDKRAVTLLSTIHDDSMVSKVRRTRLAPGGREEISKPHLVEEYNTYMGGVDKSDQLLSYYGFSHRTVKWWRRAFYHLLDVASVNAFILYTESNQPGMKLNHENFRIQLAIQLLEEAATTPPPPLLHPPPFARLTEHHFPEKVPPRVTGQAAQPECVVCTKQKGRGRKTTTYQCKQCKLPMCIVPCFELYHTKPIPAATSDYLHCSTSSLFHLTSTYSTSTSIYSTPLRLF